MKIKIDFENLNFYTNQELLEAKKAISKQIKNNYDKEADEDPCLYAIKRTWFFNGSIFNPKARTQYAFYIRDHWHGEEWTWGEEDNDNIKPTDKRIVFYTKRMAEFVCESLRTHGGKAGKYTYYIAPMLKKEINNKKEQ